MAKLHNHFAILMISTLFLLNSLQITGQSNDNTTTTTTAPPATCGMESLGGCYNKHKALKLKIIAIFSILVASMIGVCLPFCSHVVPALHPDQDTFSIVKAFASGVILATGYMHVLPDSFTCLESKCLPENPWKKFPFTTFVAMLSAVVIMMIDSFAMAYHKKRNVKLHNHMTNKELKDEMVEMENASKVHAEVANENERKRKVPESLLRHRIVAQVLEMGIVVHSVVIGLSLGASENPCTIRPLVAALCFHQLFEGMGLGGCIIQAEYGTKIKAIMVFFFSVTTPAGIVLGIGLTNVYSETSPTALIVVGILNAASAGLLNYMALVDLLAADFMGAKLQGNMKLQAWAYIAVLLGAGGMSVMAMWA